jgi:putative hydrolase
VLKSDLHIHTLMSGHAFCTINECIQAARNCGLSHIAITDHGPAMEHSAHEGYFEMSNRLPKLVNSVNVLFGCEMNILNQDGDVDLSAKTMSGLDIVLAGIHERTPYRSNGEAENTNAIINAMMRHSEINVITHPFRSEFPISVQDVVHVANECNVILEINLALMLRALQQKSDDNFSVVVDKTAEMISCLHSTNSVYLLNSDAHYSNEIGISDKHYNVLIAELGILPQYVLNNDIGMLKQFIPSIILEDDF